MRILFAADLDNTLIYSYKRIQGAAVAVEQKEEKVLSYMTQEAHRLLQETARHCIFVPVTTRSLEQYQRVRLLKDETPPFAITSNGGQLLIEGVLDPAWHLETLSLIEESQGELEKAALFMEKDKRRTFDVRLIDEVFLFTKSKDAYASKRMLEEQLDRDFVTVDTNGEKLYVLPKKLHKGAALKRLQKRLHPNYTIAAGDSQFDLSMLQEADYAFAPADTFSNEDFAEKPYSFYTGSRLQFADVLLASLLRKVKGDEL